MCESDLVRLFKDGHTDAFDAIYGKYYKPIYNYISKLINDKTAADDLTQETLIKVLGRLKDADEERSLSPWIYRIAHNTSVDYLRKNRINFELIDDIDCNDKESNSPEYYILNKEKQARIKEALMGINAKYQKSLLLRDFHNLPYRDIAALLSTNESTVKTLIRRARQQFQRAYVEAG